MHATNKTGEQGRALEKVINVDNGTTDALST